MLKKVLKRTKFLLTKRNRKFAKAVAKETVREGRILGKLAAKKVKKDAPKARRVLKREARSFRKRVKKIRR